MPPPIQEYFFCNRSEAMHLLGLLNSPCSTCQCRCFCSPDVWVVVLVGAPDGLLSGRGGGALTRLTVHILCILLSMHVYTSFPFGFEIENLTRVVISYEIYETSL